MSSRFCALSIILLTITSAFGAKRVEGVIIFKDSTANVTFIVPGTLFGPSFQKLQNKVKYIDAAGKKRTLRPTQAREIQFVYFGEKVRMISKSLPRTSSPIGYLVFLKLEIDGEVKLFREFSSRKSPGMYNPAVGGYTGGTTYSVENYILQKGNGKLKYPRTLGFKKDMAEYFSDCPALAEKIEGKDFRKNELESIVLFYNDNCN